MEVFGGIKATKVKCCLHFFFTPKDCTEVLFIVHKDAKLGMCFERMATVRSFCCQVSFRKY